VGTWRLDGAMEHEAKLTIMRIVSPKNVVVCMSMGISQNAIPCIN
jgi:hypothetical protein